MTQKMILFLGCLMLVQGVQAGPASLIPFTGVLVEGALGSAESDGLTIQTETKETSKTGGPATFATFNTGSNASTLGRLAVGYGYTFPSNFNLTGTLSLSTDQKVDKVNSKLTRRVDMLVSPGYYIEKWRTLVYGSLGYSWASLDSLSHGVERLAFTAEGERNSTVVPQNSGDGKSSVSGMMLGLGVKYAINDALYAGVEFNRIRYSGARKNEELWMVRAGKVPTSSPTVHATLQRDDNFTVNTFLLTVGYRFR